MTDSAKTDIPDASAESRGLCRFCHAFCPMKVTLQNVRVTRVIGDKDNPAYHGYSCLKGRNYHHLHSGSPRMSAVPVNVSRA